MTVPDEKDGSSSLFVIRTDGRRNRRLLKGNDYQDPHSLQYDCASWQPIR